MSQTTTQRPPQVTLAGTVVVAGSVIVVLSMWNRVATLRSIESRESIERFLAGSIGKGLGLDVEQAIGLLHVAAFVTGGCAAATAVLGWFALRRDKTSRLVLTILVVPLFVAGVFVDRFTSSFVAAAVALLWISPAREWFATGSWTPPQPRQSPPTSDQARAASWPPAQPPDAHREQPEAQPSGPPPQATPYASSVAAPHDHGATRAPHHWGPAPQERPRAVVTAAVLAIVMSVLVGAMMVLMLTVVGLAPELVEEEMARQPELTSEGIGFDQLRPGLIAVGALFLVLCGLALTFAGFLLAGREWARRGLMATAAFTAGICLLSILTAPASPAALPVLLPAGAAVTALVLLRRPESRAWCQESSAARDG